MNWPTSQDYNEAIQNPKSCFSDPSLKDGEAVVNSIGLPVPRSGNFADVYEYKTSDGKTWALKCFTRKVAGLQERYAKIDEHIGKANFPFTVGFKFLAEGVRVRGQWFPLLKMEWVEGFTLNEFIRDNAGKPQYLQALMQMWGKLVGRLRDGNFAHADLQHGNVLLVPGDAQNKLGLKLIDYDGMWVPALSDYHSGEIGHPNFQHPLRLKERLYNADVDRFPHLVIASALRATVLGGKALWDKFDNGDNLLFKETDLREPGKSPVFKALWELHDDVLCALVGKMALASREPLRKTPWLDDMLVEEGGLRLTEAEEKKVIPLLGVAPHFTAAPTASPTAAAGQAASEFADFDSVDAPTDRKAPTSRTGMKPVNKPKKTDKKPAPTKSMLPYYIGGGVAALALVVGGVLAMSGGSKNPPAPPSHSEVAANDPKQETPKVIVPPRKDPPGDPPATKGPDSVVSDKKDPPPEAKQEPKSGKPGDLNMPKPAVGVINVPNSNGVVVMGKDEKWLTRYDYDQRKVTRCNNHTAPVRAMACAPDGSMVVSGGEDNFLRIWTLGDPVRQLHELKEHDAPVVACDVSKDGERAVSVGSDNLLCEWDIKAGKLLRKFPVPATRAVAYLADGKSVLLGTANESAAVFDLEKKEKTYQLAGHKGGVGVVCISKDGTKGFTGGDDFIIRVWNLSTGMLERNLEKHQGAILSLANSPDGRILASADSNNQFCLWAAADLGSMGTFTSPSPLRCVALSPSNEWLILGSGADAGPGGVKFAHLDIKGNLPPVVRKDPVSPPPMTADKPGELTELWNKPSNLGYLTFTPDGGKIAMPGASGTLRTFSLTNGSALDEYKVGEQFITKFAWCADGNILLVRSGNPKNPGEIYVWDPQTKTRRFTIEDGNMNLRCVEPAPKANVVLVGQKNGGYCAYSLTDGKKVETVVLPNATQLHEICCSEDGEAVLAYLPANSIYFRPKRGDAFRTLTNLEFRGGTIPRVRMSPDAKRYVHFGYGYNVIHVYETATGKHVGLLEGHTAPVRDVAFTPDGKSLLSIAADGDPTLRMWDLETFKQTKLNNIAGTHGIHVAVSPDARHVVATMGSSGKTELWRLPDQGGGAIVKKDGPLAPAAGLASDLKEEWTTKKPSIANSLAFLSDGESLVSNNPAGTIDLINAKDGTTGQSFKVTTELTDHIMVGPEPILFVRTVGSKLIAWDMKNQKELFAIANVPLLNAASSWTDATSLMIPGNTGEVQIYSLADGSKTGVIKLPVSSPISRAGVSGDGKTIGVWFSNGELYTKTTDDPISRNVYKAKGKSTVRRLALSPNGQLLAVYELGEPIRILETRTGKERQTLTGHTSDVYSSAS